jgi:hypothetical protein
MDKDILVLIERAVSAGIRSNLWFVLLGSGVASAVGVFVGAFLKQRGEQLATQAGFKRLLEQVEQQTKVTKAIETELQKGVNIHSERFKAEFTTYKELWQLLMAFRRLGIKIVMKMREDEELNDELLETWDQSAKALLVCLEDNMPFFTDEVRYALLEFKSELASVVEMSRRLPPQKVTYLEELDVEIKVSPVERAKAMIELNKRLNAEKLDTICKIIRERVGFA